MPGETPIRPPRPDLSIVIPVFDEEDVLPLFLDSIRRVCDEINGETEIIFIDDGSTDGTSEILDEWVGLDRRIRALLLSRHFGHQAAVAVGLREARGNRVLVMDGDLQDPPELVHEFLIKAEQGFDGVIGRVQNPSLSTRWFRTWARIRGWLRRSEMPLESDVLSLMSRRVVDILNGMPETRRNLRGMQRYIGFKLAEIPYQRNRRAAGKSRHRRHSQRRLLEESLNTHSRFPFRVSGLLGATTCLATSFGLLGAWMGWVSPAGLSRIELSLFMGLGFLGGFQMWTFGHLGHYQARLFQEVLNRPDALVARRIAHQVDAETSISEALEDEIDSLI